MPNGRFLSKSVAFSTQLASVSLDADYLFGRCIPHLDVEGRLSGEPNIVKATAVPLRAELTSERVAVCLAELAAATGIDNTPLVRWYQVRGHKCLEFPSFRAHQKGMHPEREAKSKLPAPTDPDATPVVAGASPDLVRTNSGPTPAEVRLREVKRREEKVSIGQGAESARPMKSDWLSPILALYHARNHTPDARAVGTMRRQAKALIDAHGMNVVVACTDGMLGEWKGDILPGFHQVAQNIERLKAKHAVVATELYSVYGPDDPQSWAPMQPEWPDGWKIRQPDASAAEAA